MYSRGQREEALDLRRKAKGPETEPMTSYQKPVSALKKMQTVYLCNTNSL